MVSLNRISVFVEVARLQSFAAAAREMGMTGPAVSKQVAALENELGVRLLNRTTRLVTLTEEGAIYYDKVRQSLEDMKEAASEIQDLKATPQGTIKISIPLSFGHMHLLPVISGFARRYPNVRMEVYCEDRQVDLIAEGYSLAVRVGTSEDSSLVARFIADCPVLLVASPDYIARKGLPDTPADLKTHDFIIFSQNGHTGEWRYQDNSGKRKGSYKFEGVFHANTAEMMLSAALDGVGIGRLPIFSVATHLKAGQLVHILPEYNTVPLRKIMIVMPPNRHRSAKIRLLADWIANACKAMPLC